MEDQDKKFDQPDDQPQSANQDSNPLRTLAVDDYAPDYSDSHGYNRDLIQDFSRLFDTSVPDGIRRTTLLLLFLLSTVWLWNTVQQGFLKEESSSMGLLQMYESPDAKEDASVNPENKISITPSKLIDKRRRTGSEANFNSPINHTQTLIPLNNLNEMNTTNLVSGNNNSVTARPYIYLAGTNGILFEISWDDNNCEHFNTSYLRVENDIKTNKKLIIEKSSFVLDDSSFKVELNYTNHTDINPINILFNGIDSGIYSHWGDNRQYCSALEVDTFVNDKPKMLIYSCCESGIQDEKIDGNIETGGDDGSEYPVSTRICKSQYKLKTRLPINSESRFW